MSVHSIKTIQKIPGDINAIWQFFSKPENLPVITPPWLRLKVTSQYHGPIIYPGQIIEYTVCPIASIPLYWMTEITQVIPQQLFVDEQRYGPYSLWHHQHHFVQIAGGVQMTDIVHYKIPLGFLGEIANQLYVHNRLKQLFIFRFHKAAELFGKWPGQEISIEIK